MELIRVTGDGLASSNHLETSSDHLETSSNHIDGDFGKKYIKTTSHQAIRKLIGGRADVSYASDKFWKVCYERIRQKDVTDRRKPLKDFTAAEREIWRAFVRRASISCNRKKIK